MANSIVQRPYKGVFPVVPTVFDGDGRLDLDAQKRAVDFMIDAGEQYCHLGEGCTYDPGTDTAWRFDIRERILFQADLDLASGSA